MTIWWLAFIIIFIASGGIAFIWLALKLSRATAGKAKGLAESYEDAAARDIEHIFNNEFREELRNRGRLHFEKIITENAMFLQQDLRLTTSQLNEYMKNEMATKLKDEFNKYEQSIDDAKQLATQAIQKTNEAVEEQRKILSEQVQKEVTDAKRLLLQHFESNMTDIVNHYILAAIGNQIDLSDQLEYIIGELSANKAAIAEDIQNGA
ncbi:MAG: hypothetical protein ACREHG_01365 [Candidatus Saccharimonadales bacterium]